MSLETLLEAAEFLEWRNHSRTRVDSSPRDPHGYSMLSTNDSDGSPESSNSGKLSGNEDGKDKRRAGGAGTREVHNKLEKNRRAHLKECFEFLKNQIPTLEDKRTSNLSILRGSLRYIQALRRKEKEYELEMQRLAREKISLQERMAMLKSELVKMNIEVDINQWAVVPDDQGTNSTSTATEQGSPICSEDEDEDEMAHSLITVHEVKINKTVHKSLPHPIVSQASMTVLKVSNPNPAPSRTLGNNTTSKVPMTTSTVSMPTVQTTSSVIQQTLAAAVRPPVTQILARQLLQRQQSGTSQGAVQVSSTATTSATGANKLLPHQMKSISQMRAPLTLGPFGGPANAAQLAALNKLAGTAALSIPMSSAGTNLTPLTKALNQPILMSPSLQLTTPMVTSVTTASSQISSATTITTASASLMSLAAMQNGLATSVVTPATQTQVNAAAINSIRPTIIGPGPHHAIMTAPLAALMPQTVPRTTISGLSGISNMVGHTSMQQLISLAQMGQAGGAHLVSPMVMSPSVQLAASSGLSQSQISMLASQPLLQQIPIFSPGLLKGGQMISQPVVKPFVVVTVPNVVPTTSAPSVPVTTTGS
ncbi:max-binding protein MNT-like [Ylistrum balloti]|uniref:max-binding protein MNT-like n=1 Tax=Ylistrum balloti TaxID=509963 RepID=UPI00290592BC|nr:max-binding protein MNT-like [Ylistrum balloti]